MIKGQGEQRRMEQMKVYWRGKGEGEKGILNERKQKWIRYRPKIEDHNCRSGERSRKNNEGERGNKRGRIDGIALERKGSEERKEY